ncbi:MAG TPA: CHAT domain-containing tetratricopeptide repeat protein [Terriglobales bacterium]
MKLPVPRRLAVVAALASFCGFLTLPASSRVPHVSVAQAASPTGGTPSPDQIAPTPLTLTEGLTLTRGMKGGETQQFQFQLEKGRFLNARIEQQGIDVEVHLIDAKGSELAGMDSLNGDFGPEVIATVIPDSGEYRLQIACSNIKAEPGHYELKIVSLHPATTGDRTHAAAEQAMANGVKLLNANTAESRAQAIENFQSAARFFESDGEPDREALALYSMAFTYANSSEFRKALIYLPQAQKIFEQTQDANMEATTLTLLGGANDVLGNLSKATEYYQQALEISQRERFQNQEASALNDIGKIYHDVGEWQTSLQYYQRALPLFQSMGDRDAEAVVLGNLGSIYYHLGDFDGALHFLQQALAIRKELGDKDGQAYSLTSLGNVYRMQDKREEAMLAYSEALRLRKEVGDPRAAAETLDFAGAAYRDWGDLQTSLAYHQQSLELRRSTNDLRGQALSLANLGQVEYLLKHPDEAMRDGSQALEIYRKIGDQRGLVDALELLARTERDQGKLIEARDHLSEALTRIENQRSQVASEDLRTSYFALSHEAYLSYVDLLMRLDRQNPEHGYSQEALEVSERARARSLLELLTESHTSIHQGVDAALVNREQELGELLDAKAERLTHSLGLQEVSPEQEQLKSEIGELERQYQDVRAQIRASSPQFAAISQPEPASVPQIQHEILDADTVLVEYLLGDSASYVWVIGQSGLHSYRLPKREAIEDVARDLYQLLATRGVSNDASSRENDVHAARDAKQLSEMILRPVAQDIQGKRLLIVADGALQYLPFAMLPSPATEGDRPLLADHEIVSLPSVSVLAVQRAAVRGRVQSSDQIAVLADPVFSMSDPRVKSHDGTPAAAKSESGNATRLLVHTAADANIKTTAISFIPRLPFTRQEAERILAASSGPNNFEAVDFQASRELVLSNRLSRYKYVHFATHGYLDSQQPELSAIVLSMVDEQGHPEDGFLRVHDIYNLHLPADVVVLSACQTGLGKEVKGEGLVGLTRGFMYAGAARVVVSLWSVSDKATADLMADFYAKMLAEKLSPAAALRAAQLEVAQEKRWASPYFWAPFIVQGDWK